MTQLSLTHPFFDDKAIRYGFFTRHGGVSSGNYASLNGGLGSNDDPANVLKNRQLAAASIGGEDDSLCGLYQIHSGDAYFADNTPLRGDALVTNQTGITCVILTADCAPVLFADTQNNVIAAAHAGWRGAARGIIPNTIALMLDCGASLRHIKAVIGPSIQQKSYQVGDDLRSEVLSASPNIFPNASTHFTPDDNAPHHWHFDLSGYILSQLRSLGIAADRLLDDSYSDDRFFSHRRATHLALPDTGRQPDTGRMMSMIRLTPK